MDPLFLEDPHDPLAYRFFAKGKVFLIRDRDAFVASKARTIVEYLDFRPIV